MPSSKQKYLELINKVLVRIPIFRKQGVFLDLAKKYELLHPFYMRGTNIGSNSMASFQAGEKVFDYLSLWLPKNENLTILDAGCGDGRVAAAFARKIQHRISKYEGFDIHKDRINALNELFSDGIKFNFKHIDIFHTYYNPEGKINPLDFKYPYNENFFDLIFLNSIFSHMRLAVIKKNLAEAAKVLKNEGLIWATIYILDHQDTSANHIQDKKRQFVYPYDEGMTSTPDDPERAVAFPLEVVNQMINELGLKIEKRIAGYWRGTKTSLDQHEQDILILKKASSYK
jgi:ubiquinone/menaquinone biosynthesis C-methylase UbiE